MPAQTLAQQFLVSCEHGGNRIPARYRELFRRHQSMLRTHRGLDFGALRLAREMAAALTAPLVASTVSRLLVDLNRSQHNPRIWSDLTRALDPALREEILRRYYLPYRNKLETLAVQYIATGVRVLHISCHSFTPVLDGEVRNADIGLLYDPSRENEVRLCRRWKECLASRADQLRVRMNYPYAGTADGFTTLLRSRFSAHEYLGIELEINQHHVLAGGRDWSALRAAVIAALREAAGSFDTMPASPARP